ncbi:MAG: pyridoxamine 5'-phosphate oxidase [Bacteroidales bacterium]|nr:pyridoxamine 5'-phosphate oxidase [Bacteroidales bacterium]MCF8404871.1 pyridoxamine 5'-phosphate oxidase [Bacteroidales bacterium]
MNIESLRKEYKRGELSDNSLEQDPMSLFNKWFEQAMHADIIDVNAVTLGTSSSAGKPSLRTVLLKKFDTKGFTFFTNYNSRKGKELTENPFASMLIFWKELERQIRIEGKVEKGTSLESDSYFNSRSLESRISGAVSPQSEKVPSRRYLEEKWVKYLKEVGETGVKRPDNWGAFRLIPERIEFWQGRPNRLHDRILYSLEDNVWQISRLAP